MGSHHDILSALRKWMGKEELDALVLPAADPHMSEYLPDHWKVVTWLSGFTGSAATVVVTMEEAFLWTDSRYFIQAEIELKGTPFMMKKDTGKRETGFVAWLISNLDRIAAVGVDGRLFSISRLRQLEKKLGPPGIDVLTVTIPFTRFWPDRPALPREPVFEVPSERVGRTREENLDQLRTDMLKMGCHALFLTDPDEIGWVLNIRGGDIPCNTSALCYLVVREDHAILFIDREKLPDALAGALEDANIRLQAYGDIRTFLGSADPAVKWILDPNQCNASLATLLPADQIIESPSEAMFLKAKKSDAELEGIRSTMIKDGVALTRAFLWLEGALGKEPVTEYDFAQKIANCRAEEEGYFCASFPAIVGYRGNGAIVHYRPDKDKSLEIRRDGILLVDSGGHYETGTTDITRTIALSTPPDGFVRAYTAVLKGHIALANAVFPEGTKGYQLDTLARQHLWSEGLNYGHGTGHGVGFFASVHEPPYGISPAVSGDRKYPLEPGVVLSNEPGYYQENAFGIRIENLVLVCQRHSGEEGCYYGFETLTLFPIDLSCVDESALTRDEVAWIDTYHVKVRSLLLPHMEGDAEKRWITDRTKRLGRSK